MKTLQWMIAGAGAMCFLALACQPRAGNSGPSGPAITSVQQSYVSHAETSLLLAGGLVLVGDGQDPIPNTSVLIVGERIEAVGPDGSIQVPDETRVVDVSGKTLIPGFVGMHNHTHIPGNRLLRFSAPRLYLAGGVTTIQTAGSADAEGEVVLAKEIEAGSVPGPTVFPTAPYVTGPDGNAVMAKPESEEEARAFVREWAAKGATWFKLYRHIESEIAAAIIDEAHRLDRKVTGHLCSLTFQEAATLGIDSIEHGLNAATDFVPDKPSDTCVPSRASKVSLDPDGPEIAGLIATLVDANVTLTSTLAILESGFPHRPQAQSRALEAMSPEMVQAYEARQASFQETRSETTSTSAYWSLLTEFERRFVSAGGRLVAGPDTGRHVLPGFGDQRNFELLAEAGFSVPEVVQIMTHNGAQALGVGDSVGLVRPGYRADLVVIDGDLTANPGAIKNVVTVFRAGIGFDPTLLIADVAGKVGIR